MQTEGANAMTAKELHKLSRQDLLQLLLAQSREVARQKESIDELKGLLKKERDLSTRLKEKLNEKDEDLDRLVEKLNEKDENIGRLKEKLNGKDELFERLKQRLDEKDGELGAAQEEAEAMRQSMESLRSRLDEKDIALETARARLDRIGPAQSVRPEPPRVTYSTEAPAAYYSPAPGPAPVESRPEPRPESPASHQKDDGEERRRYLKELLARREAETGELRKP